MHDDGLDSVSTYSIAEPLPAQTAHNLASPGQATDGRANSGHPGSAPVRVRVSAWLEILAAGMQCAVVFGLLLLSLFFTPVLQRVAADPGIESLSEVIEYHRAIPSFGFIAGFIALLVCGCAATALLERLPRHRLFWLLIVFVTAAQLVWIGAVQLVSYLYSDSGSLMDAAIAILQGDMAKFSPEYCTPGNEPTGCYNLPSPYAYFSWYPFQSGPLLWFVLMFKLFGVNITIIQVLNAFFVTGIVAILWRLGTAMGLRQRGLAAFTVLCGTCAPLLMYCSFVYTNIVGLFLVLAGAMLVGEALRAGHAVSCMLLTCVAFLVFGAGMLFKSTYVIVLLAALIAVCLAVVRHGRRYWLVALMLPLAWLANFISKLPIRWLEAWSGQSFGKGMPMLSWVAMGLSDPGGVAPGWWSSGPITAYQSTNGDYGEQSRIARETIMSQLSGFLSSPGEGLSFFMRKVVSEWAEPTFMTTFYSQYGASAHGFKGGLSEFVMQAGGGPVLRYENVSMSVVYMLAFIGLVALVRRMFRARNDDEQMEVVYTRSLLVVSFIGGFLCYLFWEAKGIYTLPFYLMILPLAAYGAQALLAGITSLAGVWPWSGRTTDSPSAGTTAPSPAGHPAPGASGTSRSTGAATARPRGDR